MILGAAGLATIACAAFMGWSPVKPSADAPGLPSSSVGPFAKYTIYDGAQAMSLAKGEYFVAVLSATCEHCQGAAELLNELTADPEVPKVAALIMGDGMEMQEFETVVRPVFPLKTFDDPLEFFNLIDKEPPRFYIVKDGAEVRHLDVLDPTLDDLKAFAAGAPAAVPAS